VCRADRGGGALFYLHARLARVEPDADAEVSGPFGEAGHHAVRVDEAVGRTIRAADDVVRDHLRDHTHYVLARNHLGVLQPESILLLLIFAQVPQVRFGRRAEEIAVRAVIGGLPGDLFATRQEVDRI